MPELLANIDVDDLERGVDFYVRAFDLRIGRRFGSMVELLGASSAIYLLEKKGGTEPFGEAQELRDYHRHWTPVHLDFVVEELEPAIERAEQAGARREAEISEQAWGRLAPMSDPFGHGFCLIQFVGRGYDEIALPAKA